SAREIYCNLDVFTFYHVDDFFNPLRLNEVVKAGRTLRRGNTCWKALNRCETTQLQCGTNGACQAEVNRVSIKVPGDGGGCIEYIEICSSGQSSIISASTAGTVVMSGNELLAMIIKGILLVYFPKLEQTRTMYSILVVGAALLMIISPKYSEIEMELFGQILNENNGFVVTGWLHATSMEVLHISADTREINPNAEQLETELEKCFNEIQRQITVSRTIRKHFKFIQLDDPFSKMPERGEGPPSYQSDTRRPLRRKYCCDWGQGSSSPKGSTHFKHVVEECPRFDMKIGWPKTGDFTR
ncbi:hypothetical protein OSTOST_06132, partial [Ostertagia ostertagi]